MTTVGSNYTKIPEKDHFAVLEFDDQTGRMKQYHVFESRKDFEDWVKLNQKGKYHAFLSRKLGIDVKVEVKIGNLEKQIEEENIL